MNIAGLICLALSAVLAAPASAEVGLTDQLSGAIHKADTLTVRTLLKAGAPATTLDSKGFAPLVNAVLVSANPAKSAEALDIAEALLAAGADIKQEGPVGSNPLAVACSHSRNVEIVKFLIKNGADVNARGYNGTFPLYQAVRKNRAAIADVLIQHGANVNAKNADGATALHYAALNGMESTVNLLLIRGAEINARDVEGKTPLSWALGKTPSSFIEPHPVVPAMAELLRQRGGTQ